MSILHHFPNLTLTADQHSAVIKLEAFLESKIPIFMLKGYAGTGKTTLIRGLVKYLYNQKKQFQVMAPTGRAAKILKQKTDIGITIHKSIYVFENVLFKKDSNQKLEEEDYKLFYPLRSLETRNTILIVDEASMISSKKSEHPFISFGTEILLNDLLTYAKVRELNTKIIFVGDPAQLPPVGDNKSWAFEPRLFISKGMSVVETELKEVKRQSDNLILKNATLLRDKIKESYPSELSFSYDNTSFIKLNVEDVTSRYIEENPMPEMNSGVIISFTNTQCYHNNKAIRQHYFPNSKRIVSGDIIQIISNNYNTYPTEIFNGDFAKVLSVSNETISQTAPVYCNENGEMKKKDITLHYRKIRILVDHYDTPFDCMINESLLESTNRELTIEEVKSIYINFIIRFDEKQKLNKENGQPVHKRYSIEFKEMMLTDPYFNALRCKYGYAITCHKAQGGEWNKVFIDYKGRVSLSEEPLRWCYTATTRGVETCFAINAPHFSRFSKFKIYEISQFGNIPKNAFAFDNVPLSPFHSENQHRCKSKKYWDIIETLEVNGFSVKNVLSRDFLERYTLTSSTEEVVIEGYHNGAGVFETGFNVISNNNDDTKNMIENIFNSPLKINYNLSYNTTFSFLDELYSIMQSICDEIDVCITNIIEYVENKYVIYFLQTDAISSSIQFYFNKNEQLTVAMPKTYKCDDDKKLKKLLTKLQDYVIQ